MPRFRPVLRLAACAMLLVVPAVLVTATPRLFAGDTPAAGAKTPHPHCNDGGALSWSTKLAQATAAASGADKLIFIEYGREA